MKCQGDDEMSTPMEFEYMEWVEVDINGWKLKKDAPEDVKKAYDEFFKNIDMLIVEKD